MTELMMISPAKLTPSPTNPRRDLGDLSDLTESIRQHGVIEPIVARPAARKEARAEGREPPAPAPAGSSADLLGLLVRALASAIDHNRKLSILKRRGATAEHYGEREELTRLAQRVAPGNGLEALGLELALEYSAPWTYLVVDDETLWVDCQRVVKSLELLDVAGVEKELVKADKAKAKAKAKRKEATQ